ncbi:MAG: hypothetical protein WBA16_06550 [Nonlabens sp.]
MAHSFPAIIKYYSWRYFIMAAAGLLSVMLASTQLDISYGIPGLAYWLIGPAIMLLNKKINLKNLKAGVRT